jgi:glycogen debranching enzyme
MISTTSWIFDVLLKEGSTKRYQSCSTDASATRVSLTSNFKERGLSVNSTIKQENIDFLVPRMLKAIDYLTKRDMDGDGLLEQNHNEDWMDTVLRTGKIVYSQACFLLALNDFASLLIELGRDSDANRMKNLANKTTKAVEQKLWSEEDGCYIDIQESHHIGGPYRTLTQDVSLYLVAISENFQKNNSLKTYRGKDHQTNRDPKIREDRESDSKGSRASYNNNTNNHRKERALHTLDAMKKRLWKDKWPLVTEVELKSTGPWVLKPNFYHNHTFWPWITGIEILARSRFDQLNECDILLSKLASEENHPHIHTFYEWINPATDQGEGAYPFRTGISAVRIAIADIVWKFKRRYFKE